VIFRFAGCELDLGRVVLRRDGREVKLEPQVFDVLAHLVQHRGEVVRKEELLDEIWGDRFVSESALTTRIKSARQAVGDDGNRQSVIRTVHGKGYEFVAAVEVLEAEPERASDSDTAASTVPVALQPLIGRETLLDRLVAAVDAHRLITLVGPGGVGKTSVGFELARRVDANYPDGVHVVELVRVVDADATSAAFATAIDVSVRRASSIDDAIVGLLRPRHCLLLLDNCEHLVDPVAALVSRVLREAPNVSIVATSREPLALPGEQVWSVDPLSTAGAFDGFVAEAAAIPAVELFVERARAADPAFVLDAVTAPVVVEICRRVDGIPLAIELAAARAKATDVAEIARRLDERFSLLKAMRRGGDPRHRAMHDAISWSYDLLEPEEQELFTRLSVFAGPFDLRSAEALGDSDDTLDLLTRLTERSMLTVRRQDRGGTRYELLETLREYGRTRLGDESAAALFTAHASHFAREAATIEGELRTPDEPIALARAEVSLPDLRAAQRFALEVGDLDTAFGLIASIREYAMRAMRYEVFTWAQSALEAPGAHDHPLAPMLTGMCAYGAWVRGEFDLAISLAHETRRLEEASNISPTGLAERVFGNVYYILDRASIGLDEGVRQLMYAEESGNASRVVHACYMYAVALSSEGYYDEAVDLVARAHAGAQTTQSPTDLASAAVAEGFASRSDETALPVFANADRIARAAGNRWMSAFARTEVSGLLVHRGQLAEGCAGLAEMVGLWYRAGEWSQQWHTLSRCMIALQRLGHPQLAAEVLGAIEAHATLGVAPMSTILHDVAFETRDAIVAELGVAQADDLRRTGAHCRVDDIVHRTRSALLARSAYG
jgi:predicted ATPase/DNA-binding winged helix-turn-helix (wHTH) protein